jgi:hypothetical protein
MILFAGGGPTVYFLRPHEHEFHWYQKQEIRRGASREGQLTARGTRYCSGCRQKIKPDEPMILIDNQKHSKFRRTTNICMLCWKQTLPKTKISKKQRDKIVARRVVDAL